MSSDLDFISVKYGGRPTSTEKYIWEKRPPPNQGGGKGFQPKNSYFQAVFRDFLEEDVRYNQNFFRGETRPQSRS